VAKLLLDYRLEDTSVSNPDGSFPTTFTGTSPANGPGTSGLGPFLKALDLGSAGKARVDIKGLNPNLGRFCIRVVFRAAGQVTGRQTLVQSNLLPFALFLDAGDNAGEFNLFGSVDLSAHGWRGPSTHFKKGLGPGVWYTADLVYDTDTAALFVDGACVGVHAFPNGSLKKHNGKKLFIGTSPGGEKDHFDGSLAGLQWYSGIPDEIEARVNEQRTRPEWFITYKRESVRGRVDLGQRTGGIDYLWYAGKSYVQKYERGAIMYHDSVGAAFELHGAIHDLYFSSRSLPRTLGYLVSDEGDTTRSGGRKNLFSNGGIYWSPGTGAVPVTDEIYLEYELLGESQALGFPLRAARAAPGGPEQEFQAARMYYKNGGERACEVHGEILKRFLETGGLKTWGYPVTNETDLRKSKDVIGRYSEFERCTFYWSRKTGAHEVHGDVRKKYRDLRGPRGIMGFPTSDEANVPGASGAARRNTFENGSLLWFGSWDSIVVATPFRVYIGRIDSKEDEGWGAGQNDIYCKVTLKDGGTTLYDRRHPAGGAWNGHNIVEPKITIPDLIVPNHPAKSLTLVVDVWDSDSFLGGGDDHLGTWTKVLNMANGWGFRDNSGTLNSGSFSMINSITGSVKPDVDPSALTEPQKWWGVKNRGTSVIDYSQYASAFRDVDSEPEWWDGTDWLEKAFYELVIRGLAKEGNCFGMCLEAIYARKGASAYGLPLDRFKAWNDVSGEFNVKHQYQVGASSIWWFVGEVLSGNTHDPVDVFTRTRSALAGGEDPVLCLAQNWDFSGKPHVILPVAWDDSKKPWEITVIDPNFPGTTRTLTIDPDQKQFSYTGLDPYSGGEWSGGRLYFIPFSLVNERPRTPVWDAILLILAGTIIILGGDAETDQITDLGGHDLDAFGRHATGRLKRGGGIDDFFVSFKGSSQRPARNRASKGARTAAKRPTQVSLKGAVDGELLLRLNRRNAESDRRIDLSDAAHRTIEELAVDRRFRPLARELGKRRGLKQATAGWSVRRILNDPETVSALPLLLREGLERIDAASGPRDFIHLVSGRRRGSLRYVVKTGLSELELHSTLQPGERTTVRARALGTSASEVLLSPERDKLVKLVLKNKLGAGRDHVSLTLDSIPVSASKALQLNPKPGLAGLELIGQTGDRDALVSVKGLIDGRRLNSQFTVPLGGGVSLKPSTVVTKNALAVSSIAQLFGAAIDGKLVQAM